MTKPSFDRLSFVGGGRVTRFLLEGWQHADAMPPELLVCEPSQAVLSNLQSDFPLIHTCGLLEAAQAPLIILALHPPDMKSVLGELKEAVSPSTVVLSLAPKVTAGAIQSSLGARRVVRMIPNAPSAVGKGYNPTAYPVDLENETTEQLERLFAPWGESPVVPEQELEAYAILSAMGPTYMWFQWQILRKLGTDFGLSEDLADEAILKMIVGAADCLMAHGRDPDQVMDMVPVKPLKPDEEVFRQAYLSRLTALYEKLKN